MTIQAQAVHVINTLKGKPGLYFEVLALLRKNSMAAGPWDKDEAAGVFFREDPTGKWVSWVRWEEGTKNFQYSIRGEPYVGGFVMRETAMRAADKELRSLGWVLV